MQSQQSAPLPEYTNPPVNEVVISVEFLPLAAWKSPHAGLYWASIRDRYPNSEVHPPIISQPDTADGNIFTMPRVEFLSGDINRTWFLSEDGTDIIQIQRDRFIVNWRRVVGNEVYPRFDSVLLPTFKTEFARFRDFVETYLKDKIEITHAEVSYYNHLVKDVDWSSMEDATANFSNFAGRPANTCLPSLETISMSGIYRMPEETGRLSFQILHALRQGDNKQIMQFVLVARGRPADNSDSGLSEWLRDAREWIVRGFTELTTETAHRRWGRLK